MEMSFNKTDRSLGLVKYSASISPNFSRSSIDHHLFTSQCSSGLNWYRQENQFGRYDIVQTVVKDAEKLSKHLLADEKITWLNGEEVVVATTVGDDCILGASVALGADTENLTEAYQHFKNEGTSIEARVCARNSQYRRLERDTACLVEPVSDDYHYRVLPTRLHQNSGARQTLERDIPSTVPTGLERLSRCRACSSPASRGAALMGRTTHNRLCLGSSTQTLC